MYRHACIPMQKHVNRHITAILSIARPPHKTGADFLTTTPATLIARVTHVAPITAMPFYNNFVHLFVLAPRLAETKGFNICKGGRCHVPVCNNALTALSEAKCPQSSLCLPLVPSEHLFPHMVPYSPCKRSGTIPPADRTSNCTKPYCLGTRIRLRISTGNSVDCQPTTTKFLT